MKNKIVVIEVYSGVASVTQTQKGITVVIQDHDHKREFKNIDGQNYPAKDIK